MTKIQKIVLASTFVLGCAASYIVGIALSKNSFGTQLSVTQAMLAFNNIKRFDEMTSCLERQKYRELKIKLDNSLTSEREILSEYLNSLNDYRLNKYIETRSDEPMEFYKSYKSKRGHSWVDPAC